MKKIFTIAFILLIKVASAQVSTPNGTVTNTANPQTGSMGIGTTSPVTNSKLDVQGGGLNIGGSGALDATLHIKTSFGGFDRLTQIHPSLPDKPALNLMASVNGSGYTNWWSWGVLTSGTWAFQPSTEFGGLTGMFIDRTGSVGITTATPARNSKLDLQEGGLNIGGSGALDATLHIKTSFGGMDRLTQIHPSLPNKPALNLMGSLGGSGNANWWSWGVLTSGTWAFQPSTEFGGLTGMFIDRTGSVGITTATPARNSKLDLQEGGLNIGGSGALDATLHIKTSFGGMDRLTQIHPSLPNKPALNLMGSLGGSGNANWWSWGVLTSGTWAFQPSTEFGGTSGMFIDRSGNVGIGATNTGSFKLAVEGKIGAREINVTTSAWADYVFENSYKLRPLAQVETYIKENKHLPEIPSASDVKANGINLGEMDALLLKKIEELTLYTIEINKKMEEMQMTVKKVQAENESLKEQMQRN